MNAKSPPSPSAELVSSPLLTAGIDIEALARLGAEASSLKIETLAAPEESVGLPKTIPIAVINGKSPAASSLADLFERYRLFPARKTGQARAQTLESFIALVNRHKTPDTAIFADMDWKKPGLTAVIDYHEAASAGRAAFGKHRVHYNFPLSEEWQKWIEMNAEPMKQEAFAWFLEDRVSELAAPTDEERILYEAQFATALATPAQVVELSRGLAVNVASRVKATTTLQSGEGQIAWEEAHTDGEGKPLKVPGMFMLAIAPFFMGDKVRVPVRLRYRAAGGSISWFYQLYRPDLFITEHVRHVLADTRNATELPVYEGAPEMSA